MVRTTVEVDGALMDALHTQFLALVIFCEIHGINRFPGGGNFIRRNEQATRCHKRLVGRYGKAKALSVIARKLGRTVYVMRKRRTPFDAKLFFETGG
jgi:hypothetical protein